MWYQPGLDVVIGLLVSCHIFSQLYDKYLGGKVSPPAIRLELYISIKAKLLPEKVRARGTFRAG